MRSRTESRILSRAAEFDWMRIAAMEGSRSSLKIRSIRTRHGGGEMA
jgi:hypothetical protein